MTVLVAIVTLAIMTWVVWTLRQRTESSLRRFIWPAFGLKMLAGVLIGWLYTKYYAVGDTVHYITDAEKLVRYAHHDFVGFVDFILFGDTFHPIVTSGFLNEQRGSFLFVKWVACVSLLTNHSYIITSFYFSFLSFLSAWLLVNSLVKAIPGKAASSVMAFFFFPSCVLWSSGLLKESLTMAALFVVAAVVVKLWFRLRVSVIDWAGVLIASWLAWHLKYFLAAAFLPCAIGALVLRAASRRWNWSFRTELLVMISCLGLFLVTAGFLHPNFRLHRLPEVMVENYEAYQQMSAPGDAIQYFNLTPDWSSVLLNAPWALLSGLFRPFVWEAQNMMQLAASLENMGLLVMTLFAFRKIRLLPSDSNRLLVVFTLTYAVALCVFLSLTAPNFGSLHRYRVGFLPFFVLIISDLPWIRNLFTKLTFRA
jgi:hypothetical protein